MKLEGPLTQDVVVIRINKNVSDTHTQARVIAQRALCIEMDNYACTNMQAAYTGVSELQSTLTVYST